MDKNEATEATATSATEAAVLISDQTLPDAHGIIDRDLAAEKCLDGSLMNLNMASVLKNRNHHVMVHGITAFVQSILKLQGHAVEGFNRCFHYKNCQCSQAKIALMEPARFKNVIILKVLIGRLSCKFRDKPFYKEIKIRDLTMEQILELPMKIDAADFANWILETYREKLTEKEILFLEKKDFFKLADVWWVNEKPKAVQCRRRATSLLRDRDGLWI